MNRIANYCAAPLGIAYRALAHLSVKKIVTVALVAFAIMYGSPYQAPPLNQVMLKSTPCNPFSSEPIRLDGAKIMGANNQTLCFFKNRPDLHPGDRLAQRIDSDGFFGIPCLEKIAIQIGDRTIRGICSHAVDNATDLRSSDFPSKMGEFSILDVQKMALLDVLLGNTDRHLANALIQGDRLIPIDHDAAAMGRIFLNAHWLTTSEPFVNKEFQEHGRYLRSFWIKSHALERGDHFQQINAPVDLQIVNWINHFDIEMRAADLLNQLDQSEADYIRLHVLLLKEVIGVRGHTFAEFVRFQQEGLFEEALRAARDVCIAAFPPSEISRRASPSSKEAFRRKFFIEFPNQLRASLNRAELS